VETRTSSNGKLPTHLQTVCDKLNIMASIHNSKLIAAPREAIIDKLEERIGLLEQGLLEQKASNSAWITNLVSHILDNPIYITKSKDNWMCYRCPYKRFCEGYKDRYQLGRFPSDEEIIKKVV
jgi:hypothetical protein